MLTLSHLNKHLFRLFALAESSGLTIEVRNKNRAYVVTIIPTGEHLEKNLWRKERKLANRKKAVAVPLSLCPTCNSLMASTICLNKKCNTNKK